MNSATETKTKIFYSYYDGGIDCGGFILETLPGETDLDAARRVTARSIQERYRNSLRVCRVPA